MRAPRTRLLLAVLLLAAFTLTVLDVRAGQGSPFDVLRRGAGTALGPVQRAVAAAGRALPGGGDDDETARLRQENDALRRRLVDLQGAQAQSDELAGLLRLKDEGSYTTVLARVVGFGARTPFETTVTLDVGSRDGVRAGQTVTSSRGLVGRTVQVTGSTCTVALVTDPTVSVGTRRNASPRSFGLTTGLGRRGLSFALVEPGDGSALQVGDALVTAGSDTFAPGVPVGRVTAVDLTGTVPTATVAPYADLGALDLLQVVVQGPRTEPRVAIPPS